jgi:non-ribosomal peptide synthetase component E (peptide arylation enzyme)
MERMTDFIPAPAHRAARHRRAAHWTDDTLVTAILPRARAHDTVRPALVGPGEVGDLPGRVERHGGGLGCAGLPPGERVGIDLTLSEPPLTSVGTVDGRRPREFEAS